jgi:hypothetical protein
MAYSFTPKSEEECLADELCPKGLQPFTVMESDEATSKKDGKSMVKLKVCVHGDDGFDYHVYDYISANFMAYKFRHFFHAVGMGAQYATGTIEVANNALKGKTGWCDVTHEKAKDGYGPKAKIADYNANAGKLPPEANMPQPKPPAIPASQLVRQPTAAEDDDVPF